MILTHTPRLRVVIYEEEGSSPLPGVQRFKILQALLEKGYAVSITHDAAHISGGRMDALVVLERFMEGQPPRIVDSALDSQVIIRDIGGADADAVVDLVERVRAEVGAPQPGGWKPWFPVIDYGRCVNCQQCLSFCLFGVYGVSPEGMIEVQNEASCKTDCPACARVCPEAAIIFPKYRMSPINGDTVNSGEIQQEIIQVSIPSLLGGDTLQALRDRNAQVKNRFSKEQDENQARGERQRHLQKIQQALDIPDELLKSLTSGEETPDLSRAPHTQD